MAERPEWFDAESGPDNNSGVHILTEREVKRLLKERLEAERGTTKRQSILDDIKVFAASSAAILVVAFGAFLSLDSRADTKAAAVETRAALALDEHKKEEKEAAREIRRDIRELYQSQQTGRPSARLEQPVPAVDGGR